MTERTNYLEVDEDGYTTFQLWCFMELYGVHMGMTLPNVVEPLDIVFDAPTIEERKTGKWVRALDGIDGHVRCSQCMKIYDWDVQAQHYDYCPKCGAKMEEGDTP